MLWENIAKNVAVLLLLLGAYSSIQSSLTMATAFLDKGALGSMLVAVSILAVTACFGNFAFTYEKVEHKNYKSRWLAHAVTGSLMLLIGLSLEMTSVVSGLLIGSFPIFNFSLLLLYFTCVLYDFWDLKRTEL